ncbi:DMT family transporter [Acaryochloris sp. 'Moss Beach']|uniref:DMT family transporter n=1 Tax=Acaryochloris sp. 'Moss Beach' TaxID=2740837 RepID=UPI001F32F4A8|nr:DMT family transporter [Acaryochloris sp. 'Moss Beach']UJB68299.1 DMT family transporter [Acaryochloris sp. 'Moss Beach']
MSHPRVFPLTLLAMLAFAGNSILCRLALRATPIDAATFTSIRIVSGAIMLGLITQIKGGGLKAEGNWPSALALFIYAAGFSFAYIQLSAGTGALLLFGAVQVTMMGYGFWTGERLKKQQIAGFILALVGLVIFLLPGLSAPPLLSSGLMMAAGVAWGIYSLRGKTASNPMGMTAGNFLRAVPFTVGLSLSMFSDATLTITGCLYAVAAGAVTSGLGYTIWYTALKDLTATSAATVQLSVPVIAAAGGMLFLGEHLTLRLFVSSCTILGGIALAILEKPQTEVT